MIEKRILRSFISYCICCYMALQVAHGQTIAVPEACNFPLKNGDLLFVGASMENLSGAIDRVTQTNVKTAYDHIALIEIIADSTFVLHANPSAGSVRELFSEFLAREKEHTRQYNVYRLQPTYQHAIPNAVLQAKQLLGRPYNHTYILNDDSLYCSDFIERIFRADRIFALEPMTFIDPATQEIDAFWKTYYQKLGVAVPEGLPGCNPNGMAASHKLDYVGKW